MILLPKIILLLLANNAIVQQPSGLRTLDTSLYQVVSYSTIDYLIIRNKNNQLYNRQTQLTDYQREYGLNSINSELVKPQLKQIILTNLRQSPTSVKHEAITTFLYINDTGRILEVEFAVKSHTYLLLHRLAYLEDSIKKRLVFSFEDDSLKGISFIKFGLTTQVSN